MINILNKLLRIKIHSILPGLSLEEKFVHCSAIQSKTQALLIHGASSIDFSRSLNKYISKTKKAIFTKAFKKNTSSKPVNELNADVSSSFGSNPDKVGTGYRGHIDLKRAAPMKNVIILLLLLILSLPNARYSKAQEGIDLSSVVTYKVQRDGKTKVINDITITNLNSTDYVKSFSLNIFKYFPEDVSAYKNDQKHSTQLITNGSKSTIVVEFTNNVYGIGNKRNFKIEYSLNNLAAKTGEIWELTLPKLDSSSVYSNYNAILSIPKTMGDLAYLSPIEDSFEEDDERNYYVFAKDKVVSGSITAGFGEFQVFSFELNYHVENPLNKRSSVEIAIPPDTSTQTMLYESIDPVPKDVVIDSDGNWLAVYDLEKKQRIDVKAIGKVQIFAAPRRFSDITEEVYQDNLGPSQYWQSEDEKINDFAKRLKTPEKIYEFTKNTLTYNYSKVTPNVERNGALSALQDPKNAICMEFTDLFIALSRAAGIPAREINGYAYTENPELQPISLVADVLHSWPEYWDKDKKVWVPVDPTWGSTSSQDYFWTFDLRHFAFVIHGKDPEKPYSVGRYKLGDEPQKDVFIKFGEIKDLKNSDIKITHEKNFKNPFTNGSITFMIHNSGPRAVYSAAPKIYFDNQLVESQSIEVLPPFSTDFLAVDVERGLFMQNTPDIVSFTVNNESLDVQTNKNKYILINLTIATSLLLILTFFFFTKFYRNKLPRAKSPRF